MEVAGRCVHEGLGGGDDGGAGRDAPACAPTCEGDVVRTCEGATRSSVCLDDSTARLCEAGRAIDVGCGAGCSDALGLCVLAETPPTIAASLDAALATELGSFVVPLGATYTLDTDTGEIRQGSTVVRAAGVGVISGVSFTSLLVEGRPTALFASDRWYVEGALIARGDAGLVWLAQRVLDVSGTLDVSADGVQPGPGGGAGASGRSVDDTCAPSPLRASGVAPGTSGTASGMYAAGGGGGGLGTPGGDGGPSSCGRVPAGAASTMGLAGGSGGGAGAGTVDCAGLEGSAPGGGGGGMLFLVSPGLVRLAGTVDAGGGGGGGGRDCGGGGGGGSGGLVVVEASMALLEVGHLVAASGGGGGGGGGRECIATGTCAPTPPAAEGGEDATPTRRASGEAVTDAIGGSGSSALGAVEAGTAGTYNGGGGGGGAGRIVVRAHRLDGTLESLPSLGSGLPLVEVQ